MPFRPPASPLPAATSRTGRESMCHEARSLDYASAIPLYPYGPTRSCFAGTSWPGNARPSPGVHPCMHRRARGCRSDSEQPTVSRALPELPGYLTPRQRAGCQSPDRTCRMLAPRAGRVVPSPGNPGPSEFPHDRSNLCVCIHLSTTCGRPGGYHQVTKKIDTGLLLGHAHPALGDLTPSPSWHVRARTSDARFSS